MTVPKPTFRDLILVIAIAVLVIVLWRGCGERKTWEQKVVEKEEARKESVDSANRALLQHRVESMNAISQWQNIADANETEATVLRYERDRSWEALAKSKKDADKLITKIRELNGADSLDCLELADRFVDASGQVVFYKNKSDELVAKLDTAGSYKDLIIKEERELKKHALEVGYETAQAYSALHASFERLSPHSSVWGGFETTVTPGAILAGPTVAFQTAKGTQYQLGLGLDSKDVQYYVSGKILWKISFRKK